MKVAIKIEINFAKHRELPSTALAPKEFYSVADSIMIMLGHGAGLA